MTGHQKNTIMEFEGRSAEGVYFFAEVVEAADGAKAVEGALKFLEEQGVTITEVISEPKKAKKLTVDGFV